MCLICTCQGFRHFTERPLASTLTKFTWSYVTQNLSVTWQQQILLHLGVQSSKVSGRTIINETDIEYKAARMRAVNPTLSTARPADDRQF
jgi:hypothetical protein